MSESRDKTNFEANFFTGTYIGFGGEIYIIADRDKENKYRLERVNELITEERQRDKGPAFILWKQNDKVEMTGETFQSPDAH